MSAPDPEKVTPWIALGTALIKPIQMLVQASRDAIERRRKLERARAVLEAHERARKQREKAQRAAKAIKEKQAPFDGRIGRKP